MKTLVASDDFNEPPSHLKQPMDYYEIEELISWALTLKATAYAAIGPIGPNLTQEDKEDLFQDALEVLAARAKSADEALRVVHWKPWFLKVNRNKAAAHITKRSKERARLVPDFDQTQIPDDSTVDSGSDRSPEIHQIQQAMKRLEPNHRQPLEMRLSGCTNDDIAQILGITPAAARKRISRATKQLVRILRNTES